MKKTLFTAALAFVLSIGGFVLSAEDVSSDLLKLVIASESTFDLTNGLSLLTGSSVTIDSETINSPGTFGYMKNGEFCSLTDAINAAKDNLDSTAKFVQISLPKFTENSSNQFGIQNAEGEFSAAKLEVASDPLFYLDSNPDSFYQLDFSNDPFTGMIEIYVMGEPLPASTVTMLVALAAAGAFLLYRNRKTRARVVSAQA